MNTMYSLNQVPSEAQIRKYLRRILFGKDIFCPRCRTRDIFKSEQRYFCKKCRVHFSLLSHTWLKDMKLSLPKFWLLLWCWIEQVPVQQTSSLTELSETAARHWFDLFRTHLPENQTILEKIVQLDEAFFKKRILILGKQQGTRKLAYEILKSATVQRHHAAYFLQQHVKARSRLQTDGASIYRNIHRWWPVRHKKDIHSKWEFSKTSEIEGAFGNLRTFIRRMYHHVTPEKFPEYVSEFCLRFSLPEIFENPHTYLQKSLKLVPID